MMLIQRIKNKYKIFVLRRRVNNLIKMLKNCGVISTSNTNEQCDKIYFYGKRKNKR